MPIHFYLPLNEVWGSDKVGSTSHPIVMRVSRHESREEASSNNISQKKKKRKEKKKSSKKKKEIETSIELN